MRDNLFNMNLIEILQKLVEFKTVSNNHDKNRVTLDWIEKSLKTLPVFMTRHISNGFPSLVITTQKTKRPVLWLAAHIDVVPAPDQEFKFRIQGNKILGRGVLDMKFAAACYMGLLQELGPRLKQYNFGIMLTSDEEIGGSDGVGFLVKKGYQSKIVVLPDDGRSWGLESGAKGPWHLTLMSNGVAAHGARPWLGKNAIDQLSDFVGELKQCFPQEPCGNNNHAHPTINVGIFSGGSAINQIPAQAQASIDMRFVGHKEKITTEKIVQKLLRKYQGVTIQSQMYAKPHSFDLNNRYFKSFIDSAKQNGVTLKSGISHGSSDARFFAEKRIPVILSTPPGGNNHGDGEWIDHGGLGTFYKILKDFIIKEAKK